MDLKITIIQTNLHWQDRVANVAMFKEKIISIQEDTDLIILPEMFSTGFTMDATHNAEHHNEDEHLPTVTEMFHWAKLKNTAICGSIIVEELGAYYNRLFFVKPDGSYTIYDKRHLFRMAGEDEHYTQGTDKLIVEYKGWKICPLICYDLRFPVWSRNVDNAYDVLVYVANWPAPRSTAWQTLLKARAIENLSYCVGVNRVGVDGKEIEYSGDSAIINYKGDVLYEKEDQEAIHTITLSKDELTEFRTKFPAHLDADEFEIIL